MATHHAPARFRWLSPLALLVCLQGTAATAPAAPLRDGAHDFDFLIGDWKAHVRRLPDRLNGSDKWIAVGNTGVEHRPPRTGKPDVFKLRDGRCQADIEYGVAYQTSGVDHKGAAFDTGIMRDLVGVTGLC